MNDLNEKKPQLIKPPFHIDLDKLRDDAEPKQFNAPWHIVLENSPSKSEDSSIVQQQEDVELQQQPVTSTNAGNVACPVPDKSLQQFPTVIQPNTLTYPTDPSFYSVTPTNFMDVELSLNDMRVLKKENIKADIDLRKKGMGLWLELEKQRLSNDERMRYQKELDAYTDQRDSCVISNVISANGLDNNAANSITVKGVVKGFIADRATVRVHLHGKGNQEIQILSKEEKGSVKQIV